MAGDADVASHLSEIFDVRSSSKSGYVYAPVNVTPPPHPPSRDITGHLRGIFRYLTGHFATSEVSACQMPRDVPARFTLTGALTILQDRQNCQRMGVVYKLIVHSLGGG